MITIRRAKPEDAEGIHRAHMQSIQKLCTKEYTPEQIEAWGNRPYDAERYLGGIQNDFVWVIETNGSIEGYCEVSIIQSDGEVYANLCGLYLTPKVKNKKLGLALIQAAEKQCWLISVKTIKLHSTLTSLGFYEKMGFQKTAERFEREIRGVVIQSVPMEKRL